MAVRRHRFSAPTQNLPGHAEMQQYRSAGRDALIMTGLGALLGNFVGGTVAEKIMVAANGGLPWWFGQPFLKLGLPVYSVVPTIITAIKHSTVPGAMDSIYAAAGVLAATTLPFAIAGLRKSSRSRDRIMKSDIHGSAHWASREEMIEAAILPNPKAKRKPGDDDHTCYIGGYHDEKTNKTVYLKHSGPEHIIVHAPTRSGKGVGLVIPTLLAWRGSVLVHDIKGENFALTSGWRASVGQRILRFSPTQPDVSCHFNPLDEIRLRTMHEVKDVQNIATMIVDPDGKGLNDHWSKTSYSLLTAAILHVLYCRDIKEKTLAAVASLLSRPALEEDEDDGDKKKKDKEKEGPNLSGIDAVFNEMIEYDHRPPENLRLVAPDGTKTQTHRVIAESAQEMLNKAGNEKSGVISTAMSFLSLYRDPLVAETISKSDFSITDLMNDESPVSLYLITPPSDKNRLKPLIRLIINQVIRRLTESMEFKDGRSVASYKHRLLLMIDEFPSLGKLEVFEEALAFIAGYGMKAYIICQDITQLNQSYTQNESISSNCHTQIYYSPNKIETAKHISERLGKQTLTTSSHNVSYSGQGFMSYQSGSSGGITHTGRELLTPDEVFRLRGPKKNEKGEITEPGAMIIAVSGHAPVYGKQILYFQDPVFLSRAQIPPPGMTTEDVAVEMQKMNDPTPKIAPAPIAIVPAGPGWSPPPAPKKPVVAPVEEFETDDGIEGDEPDEIDHGSEPDDDSQIADDDGIPDFGSFSNVKPAVTDDGIPDFGFANPTESVETESVDDSSEENVESVETEDMLDVLRGAMAEADRRMGGTELNAAIRDESGEQIRIRADQMRHRETDKNQFSGLV